ncbi:MAG: F0F1 ATP synthase subunit B [Lachnospiraceae bacterium]|nr:F0F1 ATP synthase subunit B [Lachnospiraceae bacterium]
MLKLDPVNLICTIVNILILFFIVWRFLFKPVRKILDARQAEIDAGYDEVQAAKDEAEKLKNKYEESLAGVDAEKAKILNETRMRAGGEYEKLLADATDEAKKILDDAKRDAENEKSRIIKEAKEELADIVVEATEKIASANENEEKDRELYDKFINLGGLA